jgi:hypothetical protein
MSSSQNPCRAFPVETPPGSYSLAIVQFEVVSVPPEGQIYQSELRLDIPGPFNSYILDPDLNEIQPLNFGGTTYTIIPEFSAPMLLMLMLLASLCTILLRKKWLKNNAAYHSQN